MNMPKMKTHRGAAKRFKTHSHRQSEKKQGFCQSHSYQEDDEKKKKLKKVHSGTFRQ